jgi:Zn-dependent peptidase ImmA (M78 family)
MVMDEFDAVLKARELVKRVNPTAIPVSVELYTTEFGAVIRPQKDLGADEPGWSFENNGKYYICTNSNDRPERQRFTVCHE